MEMGNFCCHAKWHKENLLLQILAWMELKLKTLILLQWNNTVFIYVVKYIWHF